MVLSQACWMNCWRHRKSPVFLVSIWSYQYSLSTPYIRPTHSHAIACSRFLSSSRCGLTQWGGLAKGGGTYVFERQVDYSLRARTTGPAVFNLWATKILQSDIIQGNIQLAILCLLALSTVKGVLASIILSRLRPGEGLNRPHISINNNITRHIQSLLVLGTTWLQKSIWNLV